MTNLIALPHGTELVNDYRIERVLGAGGFGITYLAEEIALARRVTIKEYFPSDYAARSSSLEAAPRSQNSAIDYRWGLDRFIEEAKTLAQFNHPHIVRVYRYFRTNNTGYMVLHFEEGQSFKNWLKSLGRAPRQKELDTIVEPLLEALDLIHRQNFLHRDIAPDNIIIRKDGSPVLIDFGSARGDIAAQSKTVSALVKPGYSPYEQYAETSRKQGPWTDIYALGATLYHASTGNRPPDAPSRMVNDEYRPAHDVALSSYRPRFLRAIDSALELHVESRPQSIGAWRGQLLAPEPVTAAVPKPKKEGWLTRRNKKKQAAAPAKTVTLPPQPDAPGPKGGMVDYVDGLIRRPKREPLAVALARVGAPDAGLGDDSSAIGGYPASPSAGSGNAKEAQQERKTAGASPHARTVRFKPGDAARHLPPSDTILGSGAEAKVDLGPTNPNSGTESVDSAGKAERRRPARPRPMPSNRGQGWTSLVTKVGAAAGIAGILIAAQGKLQAIDLAALFKNLSPAHTTSTASKQQDSRKNRKRQTANVRPATRDGQRAPARERNRLANPLMRQTQAHKDAATSLAYTANGKTLVTVSKDKTLKVWDAQSGTLKRTIPLTAAPVTAVAVQADLAATGHEDGLIEVWNIATGIKKGSFRRNEANIWSLSFTKQSGRIAAASHDWKITLWDLAKPNAPVHIFDGHTNAVQALAVSPSGRYLASGGAGKRMKLWNLDTLDLIRTYPRQRDFITAIAFSPDGNLVASATLNGEIRIWSTKSARRSRRRLRGHKGRIAGLSFSPDSRLLTSAGSDGTVRLWDVKRGRTLKTLASHDGTVSGVNFAPDGNRFASTGDDGHLRLWSTTRARGTH